MIFSGAFWLTCTTLLGLLAGFAREWLMIFRWGAGLRSDAFLVAMFLPDALRMTLAGGLVAAAALPLYQQRPLAQRQHWLGGMVLVSAVLGFGLSGLLWSLAPLWITMIGPGLTETGQQLAVSDLEWLSLSVVGLLLHGVLSIPLQAAQRFIRVGAGSLLFNLPPVVYLWLSPESSSRGLAQATVSGSLLMCLLLIPFNWQSGWRPWRFYWQPEMLWQFWGRLKPLLGSNLASQGVALIERLIASLLGEGAITWVNMARKLMNLPLVALMSLNQVVLSAMLGQADKQRTALLKQALDLTLILTLPAAFFLIAAAQPLVNLLLPAGSAEGPLPMLLALLAVSLGLGAGNALLARYAYSVGDTLLPLRCELSGSLCQALALVGLGPMLGIYVVPLATLLGVMITAGLLLQRQQLVESLAWKRFLLLNGVTVIAAQGLLAGEWPAFWQLALSALAALLGLILLSGWLKLWKGGQD